MSSYTHLESDHPLEHAMAYVNKINGMHWVHNNDYLNKKCFFPHSNNDQPLLFPISIPSCWEGKDWHWLGII